MGGGIAYSTILTSCGNPGNRTNINVSEDNLAQLSFCYFNMEMLNEDDDGTWVPMASKIYYLPGTEVLKISSNKPLENITISFRGNDGKDNYIDLETYTLEDNGVIKFTDDTINFENTINMFDIYTIYINGVNTHKVVDLSQIGLNDNIKYYSELTSIICKKFRDVKNLLTYLPGWMTQDQLLNDYEVSVAKPVSDQNADIANAFNVTEQSYEKYITENLSASIASLNESLIQMHDEYLESVEDGEPDASIYPNAQEAVENKTSANLVKIKNEMRSNISKYIPFDFFNSVFTATSPYDLQTYTPDTLINGITHNSEGIQSEFADMIYAGPDRTPTYINDGKTWVDKVCDSSNTLYPNSKLIVQSIKHNTKYEYTSTSGIETRAPNDKTQHGLLIKNKDGGTWTGPAVTYDLTDTYYFYLKIGNNPVDSYYTGKYICIGESTGTNIWSIFNLLPVEPEPDPAPDSI
ncbi:MAG: hypothetical protein LBQ45_01245 [Mycoplasmataceae bacterium]|nr:hypothetical protein [Mycoplasmataceae bacterium]